MPITNKYRRIPLDQIFVQRDERQRQEDIDTTDIDDSIKARGVIQPIIVEWVEALNIYKLIAGERRYISSKKLGLPDIPARLGIELDPIEAQIIELEENVKRKNLHWKDEVLSIRKIHHLYAMQTDGWTQGQTASAIGIQQSTIAMQIRVAEELIASNKLVTEAQGWRPAYNAVARQDDVRIADAMNDLLSEGLEPVAANGDTAVDLSTIEAVLLEQNPQMMVAPGSLNEQDIIESMKSPGSIVKLEQHKPVQVQQPQFPESVFQTDFVKWAPQYTGKPFSFIHCDFPYGINLDKSEQGNTRSWGGYEDSEDTYWKLCDALCKSIDRIMMQSAHLMFWCSSDARMIGRTLDYFEQNAPSLSFVPMPLVWHKTDGKGILSDHRRRARHVYETCLYASRGDRHILRSVGDTYGAPSTKEFHQSEKPEPVLRHFFTMFVDENTRMLDATCGSGSSLRAAESLGAAHVIGLDINGDFVTAARVALRRSRLLRGTERSKAQTAVPIGQAGAAMPAGVYTE